MSVRAAGRGGVCRKKGTTAYLVDMIPCLPFQILGSSTHLHMQIQGGREECKKKGDTILPCRHDTATSIHLHMALQGARDEGGVERG